MSELWISIISGVVGALVGSVITYMLGADDRKQARLTLKAQQAASEAQQKVAVLQERQSQVEAFDRFLPLVKIILLSGNQFARLEAVEPFQVESIDYLNANGAKVTSEVVNKSGTTVDIQISEDALNGIRRVGPWLKAYDLSAEVTLRFNLQKEGQRKHHTYKGIIKQLPTVIPGKGEVNLTQIIG